LEAELTTVAIIGAGPLGRVLALLSARAGFHTVLEDVLPSNLRKASPVLDLLHARELGSYATVELVGSVEEAARDADLILDSVPDELESKLEIFWLLDRMAPPRSIFLTPTTALSIADLASCTYRAERCLGFEIVGETRPGETVRSEAYPERLLEAHAAVRLRHPPGTLPDVLEQVSSFWRATRVRFEIVPDRRELSTIA
jgi:3-hydroxybutyryl-CoA dehydrogenase